MCIRDRDGAGLRPVRAGPHLRLVPVRGGLLPAPVRQDHDAHVFGRISDKSKEFCTKYLKDDFRKCTAEIPQYKREKWEIERTQYRIYSILCSVFCS